MEVWPVFTEAWVSPSKRGSGKLVSAVEILTDLRCTSKNWFQSVFFFCFNVFLGWSSFASVWLDCVYCCSWFALEKRFLLCTSVSRVKGLPEAAGAQIVCLGLGAGLLPVSHRMWGILSGSSKEGRPASKAGGSGQGMERGRQDGLRRQTRPKTEPCSGEWPLKFLDPVHFNMNSISMP